MGKSITSLLTLFFIFLSPIITNGNNLSRAKLPTADEFPITFWAMYYWQDSPDYHKVISDKQYKLIKECNFNLVMGGPIEQAEKFGLKCMYSGLRATRFNSLWRPPFNRPLSSKLLKKVMQTLKKAPVKSPAFWGYAFCDEPPPILFERVGWLNNIINAVNDKHPVFINLLPGTNPNKFYDIVKPSVLAYDHYPIFDDGGITVDGVKSGRHVPAGFEQTSFLRSLALYNQASAKYKLKFIPSLLVHGHSYTYTSNKKKYCRSYGKMTEAKMRWQAFSSVAYRAGGIAWFIYFSVDVPNRETAAIGKNWEPTEKYWWLKKTNLEIGVLFKELQKYDSSQTWEMPPTYFWKKSHDNDVIFFKPTKLLKKVSGGLFTIARFKSGDKKERLFFLVNRNVSKTCKTTLDFDTSLISNIKVFNKQTGSWDQEMSLTDTSIDIAPGDAVLLKVTPKSKLVKKIELSNELTQGSAWKLNKTWAQKDNSIIGSTRGGSFLFLKDIPNLSNMEFEAEVTPVKAEGGVWKATGIALYQSPTEYWQFAFIESPDKSRNPKRNPKRHSVELRCLKGKWWGAEALGGSKRLAYKTFKWEYGKSYKFKLKLSDSRIDGFVYTKGDDENVLAHIAFELKGGAIKTGMPALRCLQMKSKFSNFRLKGESF